MAEINTVVDKYIALRDKKDRLKREYESKVEAVDLMLEKLEGILLQSMTAQGVESYRTGAGTAYKSKQVSVTTADREGYLNYCLQNDRCDMLDIRPNKTAVQEFVQEHGDLPPGVNWSERIKINVRRTA